jgi:hypothetical protein
MISLQVSDNMESSVTNITDWGLISEKNEY